MNQGSNHFPLDPFSSDTIKLFTDEFKVPITVCCAPYFEMRLAELDYKFGCKNNFRLFSELAVQYDDIDEYHQSRYEWITLLRSLPSMREVSRKVNDMAFYNLCEPKKDFIFTDEEFPFQDRELYQKSNEGRQFMRVKFNDAYFTLLHYVSSGSFQDDEDTYENFLKKVNCPAAWIASPKFREDLFAYLRRPLMMIRIALLMQINDLLSQKGEFELYCIEEDAVVYSLPKQSFNIQKLKDLMDCNLGRLFEVKVFTMYKLNGFGVGGSDAWWEEQLYPFDDHRRADFVNVNPNLYHILMLYYDNEFIFKQDFVINADGMLATLNKIPANPFT